MKTFYSVLLALMFAVGCGGSNPSGPVYGGEGGNGGSFLPGGNGGNGENGEGETFTGTAIGANFNENIQEIAGVYKELNATGTEYIRSFINITPMLKRSSTEITGVNTAKIEESTLPAQFVAAKSKVADAKLVLSIKIVFENLPGEVPAKGSAGVGYAIDCVRQLLEKDGLGSAIDVLVLGNEPMWENGDAAANPQNYADFIIEFASKAASWKASKGWKYKIFAGALNRVSIQDSQNANIAKIINAAQASDYIDGLDIHLHNEDVAETEASLKVVRDKYKFTKALMCSEVSMVWKLNSLMTANLGSWGTEHGYSSTMKRYEWLNQTAKKAYAGTPVSSEEFASFFNAISAYPRNWFTTYYNAFEKYKVSFITPRFSAVESVDEITSETTMWELGAIFSARFLGRAADGTMNPSPLVYPEAEACRKRGVN